MKLASSLIVLGWMGHACLLQMSVAAEISLAKKDDRVEVKVDGKPFTTYLIQSGAKPILYPIYGPGGQAMTRGYPMRDATSDEKQDHQHHRSFWFTHGDVNGISFWHENGKHGTIKHREFVEVSEEPPRIKTINDWIGPDSKKVCEDERTLTFGADESLRWIDVVVTVRATDQPVKFGDTKEGSFGIRVAGSMRVERGKGGRIVNSEGQTDGDAWGKPASWVDYSGPVADETVGVTIMNHPSSFRFPSHWHVRTYGLFAANPFGLHDFKRDKSIDASHTLQPGESFTLKYRVLFHQGNAEAIDLPAAFKKYGSEN